MSWVDIYEHKNPNNTYYCDSISLKYLANFFGFKLYLMPGINKINTLNKEKFCLLGNSDFIGSDEYGKIIDLPWFQNINDLEISPIVNEMKTTNFSKFIIGISSPKQNILANRISKKFNTEIEIHCLGAAVYNSKNIYKPYWLYFFIREYRRTLKKIPIHFIGFVKAIIYRKKFRDFLKLF